MKRKRTIKIKANRHRFIVVVVAHKKRDEARRAILNAFALRRPDCCWFSVLDKPPRKEHRRAR